MTTPKPQHQYLNQEQMAEFMELRSQFMNSYGKILTFLQTNVKVDPSEQASVVHPSIRLSVSVVGELMLSIKLTSEIVYKAIIELVDVLHASEKEINKGKRPLTKNDLQNIIKEGLNKASKVNT